ncbi:CHRD domain-containing protein [Paludisphaera mucosa]|uniref:CHRD domain-containing protein n=1 Tax=Paludisphaera mucosa TaxID=3030827 RepID=A0ABT6FHB4_9BACT|nr:CHRD domain-containing protein [Paludisphaera mucosa]MDG3006966.1 CHRD domain-containing protein [Paludisphaera mucosa]
MKPALAPLLALLLVSSAARADFIVTATLTGDQQVPPNASPAVGFAALTYESASGELAYVISFGGLSGDLAAAHIHFGSAGTTGPVILPFVIPPGTGTDGALVGLLTAADFIAAPGGPASFADALVAIQAGETYVNLHTPNFPDGEIRGQLSEFVAVPEPAGLVLLGLGGLAVGALAARRRPAGV